MNERWRKRLFLSNWPIAWKLALAMLTIFLVAQAGIFLVSDELVHRSLVQDVERGLLERAVQQAGLVRDFRDDHLLRLYKAASRSSEALLQGDQETRQAALQEELLRVGDFRDLSLLDGSGRVVASTDLALEGRDLASAPWFPEVRRHEAGISHLQAPTDLSFPAFIFYAPIREEDTGASSMALMGRLSAAFLWRLVDVVRVGDRGYAYMADENAVLIAHGKRESGAVTHALVLRAIGEENDPLVEEANAQNLYGRPIADWVNIPTLADLIQQGAPVNVHRYYFPDQRAWKTTVVVAVGEPQDLAIPQKIGATGWVFAITVFDADYLTPLTNLRRGLGAVTAAGVLFVFVAAVLFSRTITRPIRRLADLAAHVEQGATDERVHLDQQDELGRLARGLNTMLDRLAQALATQRQQLETLLHTAGSVHQDAENVSASAEEMAASTEELNASAEDVARTVQQMAQDASEQMNQVQRTAEEMRGLDREIGQVASLSQQMKASSERMRALAQETEQGVVTAREHSRRIESVVKVIEKFSRQTNMLALNATIEAARAGEMGESFAVVADEVRRLAESSRQALAEVSALNKAIRQSMDAVSGNVDQTRAAIAEVVALVEQVAQTAARQTAASHSIVEVVNGLAAIAEKNAAGSEEMAAAVEEQTAAFEEINASSQELAGLAVRLQALAQRLALEGATGNV